MRVRIFHVVMVAVAAGLVALGGCEGVLGLGNLTDLPEDATLLRPLTAIVIDGASTGSLTDAQKAQIKTIREKYLPQQMELRKATQATGNPPDEATRAKMMDLQEKQAAEIRAVLTADQQKVFDQNLKAMRDRMEARRNGSS